MIKDVVHLEDGRHLSCFDKDHHFLVISFVICELDDFAKIVLSGQKQKILESGKEYSWFKRMSDH